MQMPLLGMGTWGMGGKYERDPSTVDRSVEVLRLGLRLGLSLIDTAEIYGAGLTEEIVGQAIKGHSREKVFLISKVWKTHLGYDAVLRAAEESLKRLDTPYLDLYLIHWPEKGTPIRETMRALERLTSEGVVRAIGASNFSVSDMKDAQASLTSVPFTVNQVEYNLLHQEAGADIIPYCRANDISVIAHRPLARGTLSQRHTGALDTLSKKYDKTINQIALAWIMSQGITAIPATLNPEHLRENCGALAVTLSKEDQELLTSPV